MILSAFPQVDAAISADPSVRAPRSSAGPVEIAREHSDNGICHDDELKLFRTGAGNLLGEFWLNGSKYAL
jgi:hypothetical protein